MPFITASNEGALNGTTPVTILPSPPANVQYDVINITIDNRDTSPANIIVEYVGATNVRVSSGSLDAGGIRKITDRYVLNSTSKSLRAYLLSPPTTTNPVFVVTYSVSG